MTATAVKFRLLGEQFVRETMGSNERIRHAERMAKQQKRRDPSEDSALPMRAITLLPRAMERCFQRRELDG